MSASGRKATPEEWAEQAGRILSLRDDGAGPGREATARCPDCRTRLRGTTKGGCKHPFHNPDQPHFRETTPARGTT